MRNQTLLIGLDGATWTVLDPLMADGTMPFLREIVASGARAELRTIVPALTPPAWTSLMTGRSPGKHGIFNFFRNESPQSPSIRFLTSQDVGCETIWSLVNRHGLRATVLNFPLTFPAPPIDGYVVAGGWMPWRQLRLGCYPADLYDRLKTIPGFNPREIAMDMAHEEKALEGCRQDEYGAWIELHIRRERQWTNILKHLMEHDRTELTAILFDGVDKLQHLCWRFIDPAYADTLTLPWEQHVHEQCRDYFHALDGLIAEIAASAGYDATLIFASDHGFGPQARTLFVNTWLEEQGCLRWVEGQTPRPSDTSVLGVGQIARHVYQLDWEHTKVYASMPGGNGLHIVRADAEHPNGVSDAEYEPLRDRLIAGLCSLRDPQTGELVVAAVGKREQIFDGPYLDLAPDLTLELTDGGLFSILAAETAVLPRPEPVGTHRPEGIFIAHGPHVRQGARLPELSILDVAPLILHTLRVAIPAELEGSVPTEVLAPGFPNTMPVEMRVPLERAVAEPIDTPPDAGLDAEEEAEVLMRLRALGYVE